jgi:hypothetical protein
MPPEDFHDESVDVGQLWTILKIWEPVVTDDGIDFCLRCFEDIGVQRKCQK